MKLREEILLLLKSKYSLIWIETPDEDYVFNTILEVASYNYTVYRWTATEGIIVNQSKDSIYDSLDPIKALKNIKDIILTSPEKPMVFVLYDIDKFFDKPIVIRLIKDILSSIKHNYITIISISSNPLNLKDFDNYSVILKAGYPDENEIVSIVNSEVKNFYKNSPPLIMLDKIGGRRFIESLKGLTERQIRNIVLRCLVDDGKIDFADIKKIEKIKREIYDRAGFLEYVEGEDVKNIAGFNNLKQWIESRKKLLYVSLSSDWPKGVLICGIPGCGKSLAAKVIGKILDYPVYRFDPSSLYSKYIGESEENARNFFNTVDKLSPVCLWIDEIEKIFTLDDSMADGGVSRRIFSMFLVWLSERKDKTFIVATSNDINRLPPEFIRKGRFDEIFFADLPSLIERKEIFKIHLSKRNIAFQDNQLEELAAITEGFSGSEIEQSIVSAIYSSGGKPDMKAIKEEILKTSPLSFVKKNEFDFLRKWALDRKIPRV